uniref:Acyltransferase n=1 Tax=Trichobilharzia regenti TaxID=157069 RepID=A0AA85JSC4_TRIRE|nr:unnamed protein product [Trichobilharzia regenti]
MMLHLNFHGNSHNESNDVEINCNGEVILKRRKHLNQKRGYSLLTGLLQNITVYCYVMIFLLCALICLFILFYLCYFFTSNLIRFLLDILYYWKGVTFISNVYCINAQLSIVIILFFSYTFYWLYDWGSENHGGHRRQFMRQLIIWKWIADYFPVHLVISKDFIKYIKFRYTTKQRSVISDSNINKCLDNYDGITTPSDLDDNNNGGCEEIEEIPVTSSLLTDANYLVGFHPHGILATGAFINFATEATGFSKVFPSFKPFLAAMKTLFIPPLYRDFLMSLGIISADKTGLLNVLNKSNCNQTGNFVVVVLGGAAEALDARPGKYVIHINQRFGFFKLALQTGAYLVPCISFGEQSLYKQVANDQGSWLRWLQDKFTSIFGFAVPIFYAHGPFPYRRPIYTVVGAPIYCEQIKEPTDEQVVHIKDIYKKKLQSLFEEYKRIYDPQAEDIQFI